MMVLVMLMPVIITATRVPVQYRLLLQRFKHIPVGDLWRATGWALGGALFYPVFRRRPRLGASCFDVCTEIPAPNAASLKLIFARRLPRAAPPPSSKISSGNRGILRPLQGLPFPHCPVRGWRWTPPWA